MNFAMLHPADQIMMIMERIYGYGMTTTSGGNLSILDDSGAIWITPAGVDKGALSRQDIVCVQPDGTVVGNYKPSSEYPFHEWIYRSRKDIKAVLHAHPPALVAFSIVRQTPNVYLLPNVKQICGEVGMAEYGLPGSAQLGERIASVFERGFHTAEYSEASVRSAVSAAAGRRGRLPAGHADRHGGERLRNRDRQRAAQRLLPAGSGGI